MNGYKTFPTSNEEANDDSHNQEESDATAKCRMYVADRVEGGDRIESADFISFVSHNTFQEFVRVRFDGTRPKGNKVDGSRCSAFYEWHAKLNTVVDQPDPTDATKVILKRSTGDDPQSESNDIGPKAITIP